MAPRFGVPTKRAYYGIVLGLVALAVILRLAASHESAVKQAGSTQASATAASGGQAPSPPDADVVHLQVEHAYFHPLDNVTLKVERMEGRMIAEPARTISLDDAASYQVQIDEAVTRLSARDLSALVNSHLLRQAGSAIRHVEVHFEGQEMVVKGDVHKLVTLPFAGRGSLSVTAQGDLRMHMSQFRVAGIIDKGFLAFFGIHLDAVAAPHRKPSFRVEGDDLIISLTNLFPPPTITGRLTQVHVENQDLVQTIGIPPVPHPVQQIPKALPEPPNYLYFTGGRMRFGKVVMDNVDLKLVNLKPGEAFDFSLKHYQQQIQAGYVKVTPAQGLVVYAENYSDLPLPH